METRFITRKGFQTKIYFILSGYSHGLRKGRSSIRLWIRASSQASQDSHMPTRPAKQTRAMMMTGMMTAIMMTVVVEIAIKKSLMTRSYKRLKHRRVRPKNSG